MNIITLDVGTQGTRVSLYDQKGNKLHDSCSPYQSKYFGEGYVEQEPETWLKSLLYGLKSVSNYIKNHSKKVEAISVTSQRSSLIPMDENGDPLRDVIMWQDKRTIPQCDALIEEVGLKELYLKTGLRVNPYFVLPKIIWLKENEKDIYDKSAKFIGVQDYVNYLLTNQYKTDYSQACRTLMMNIESFEWDDDLLALGGVSGEQLPELIKPGGISGCLTKEMAELTGLQEGLPVILAGGDQQTAAMGLGVFKKGMAEANTGTGSFIITASDTPEFDEDARILCQASAVPGKWILEAGIFNSGSIYSWFANNFYKEVNGDKIYNIINKEASESGIGSNGVVMLPHFQGSAAPYWNPIAKGMFFNLSLGTKRSDLSRAILEGIALEMKENLELMEKMIGSIDTVSVAGGATKNDLFCEIQASVFGKNIVRHENKEASSMGAAMSAMVSLNKYDDFEDAYKGMIEHQNIDIFNPCKDEVELYKEIQKRKRKLYSVLNDNDLYERFAKII